MSSNTLRTLYILLVVAYRVIQTANKLDNEYFSEGFTFSTNTSLDNELFTELVILQKREIRHEIRAHAQKEFKKTKLLKLDFPRKKFFASIRLLFLIFIFYFRLNKFSV